MAQDHIEVVVTIDPETKAQFLAECDEMIAKAKELTGYQERIIANTLRLKKLEEQ